MKRKLRIAQYGCGKMSAYTVRYAMEKGAEIVCAFGRSPHNIGRDIGEIAGVGSDRDSRPGFKTRRDDSEGEKAGRLHHYHREFDAGSQEPLHGLCGEWRECHHHR